LLAIAAGCVWPLSTPGYTPQVQFVSTTTQGGWKYDYYRQTAYSCAVSGNQTFVIATKVGSAPTAARPLLAHLHGGGAGYFDAAGNAVPSNGQKIEEGAASLINRIDNTNGLFGKFRNDPAGFRMMAVSYCSHDLYSGLGSDAPNNPNLTPEGNRRTTSGLVSVKAAIQFARGLYPTTKTVLHGGSAGSVGTFSVAWSMQLQGIPPAGIIADASIINVEAFAVGNAAGICTDENDPARVAGIAGRVHPDLANPANQVDKLVSDGRLTVPILHVWTHADTNTCGAPPVACPLRDGSTVTLGYTDCIHEPMRLAISAQGPSSRSRNLGLCVTPVNGPECSAHVVANRVGGINTDPGAPADYQSAMMDSVLARIADA
jgi:hypothetical protein